MNTINRLESEVRSYCRSFPVQFAHAEGARLTTSAGVEYLDFLAGAGTMNYGHNHPELKAALLDYVSNDQVVHGLDMATEAIEQFLEVFERNILLPRQLDYKVQFTGPTGTNAVEAALKIARRVTGRSNVISFTNGFHGVSMGALAVTANSFYRERAGLPMTGTDFMPYDGYLGDGIDTTEYLNRMLCDGSSGIDHPAAVVVETVQGEGGINVASMDWLENLQKVCRQHDVLLIVDDIQMGCGRTGSFFSFSDADVQPDIVTLSKSLSGYGLPMSLVLLKPELDDWHPGEHNGTFRGHNLAFVTARRALEVFWQDANFADRIQERGALLEGRLQDFLDNGAGESVSIRGRCMVQGLDFGTGKRASAVTKKAFERGVIIETSGSDGQVVKFLTPLTISEAELLRGIETVTDAAAKVLDEESAPEQKRFAKLVHEEPLLAVS
jgi:diaminobutyrate-2-oxoglutarate transaminase